MGASDDICNDRNGLVNLTPIRGVDPIGGVDPRVSIVNGSYMTEMEIGLNSICCLGRGKVNR